MVSQSLHGIACCCKNGARVFGMGGHVACIVWFLSYERYHQESISGVREWTSTVEDAAREIELFYQ